MGHLSAPPGLGVGQTWQDVTAIRAVNTIYTNSTGRPIVVSLYGIVPASSGAALKVNGVDIFLMSNAASVQAALGFTVIVPPGATYQTSASVSKWMELR